MIFYSIFFNFDDSSGAILPPIVEHSANISAKRTPFSNALSFRVNIEKNEFNDNYFLESLFQWKPDPYTIFYAGGSQYFDENYDNFKICNYYLLYVIKPG